MENLMINAEFVQNINVGGGIVIDVFKKELEKVWILLTLNDEGCGTYIINKRKYEEELEKNKFKIEDNYGKLSDMYDPEIMMWFAFDNDNDTIPFESIKFISLTPFEFEDAEENTVWYEEMDKDSKKQVINSILKDIEKNI